MINVILLLNSDWVLFFARTVLATVMIYYGLPKVRDLKSNARDFAKMGFNPGWLWGTITAFIEFFGGVAILIGFLAEIAATLMSFQAIVGMVWKITKTDKPFTDWSYDLMLLAVSFIIITFGSGAYSIFSLF